MCVVHRRKWLSCQAVANTQSAVPVSSITRQPLLLLFYISLVCSWNFGSCQMPFSLTVIYFSATVVFHVVNCAGSDLKLTSIQSTNDATDACWNKVTNCLCLCWCQNVRELEKLEVVPLFPEISRLWLLQWYSNGIERLAVITARNMQKLLVHKMILTVGYSIIAQQSMILTQGDWFGLMKAHSLQQWITNSTRTNQSRRDWFSSLFTAGFSSAMTKIVKGRLIPGRLPAQMLKAFTHVTRSFAFTHVSIRPNSQVRQTWNVDVRVAVDVQSHPAGYTTDKNTIFVFVGWTKTLYLLQYYYFVLLKNIRKMFFSNQTQNILKTNSSTLWSICPQGVKFYAYAHVYVYVSCLPNLPIGSGHGPLQTDDLWVNKRTNKDAGMLPTIRGWWYAFLSAKLIS